MSLDSDLSITLSRSPDRASLSAATLRLDGTTDVLGTLSLLPGNRTVVFDPAAPLTANASYTLTVSTELSDTSGTPLGEAFQQAFTTTSRVPPDLIGIDLLPEHFSLGTVNIPFYRRQQQLMVLGTYNGGIERNLAPGFTGTTYTSSNPDVVLVSEHGLLSRRSSAASARWRSGPIGFARIRRFAVTRAPRPPRSTGKPRRSDGCFGSRCSSGN